MRCVLSRTAQECIFCCSPNVSWSRYRVHVEFFLQTLEFCVPVDRARRGGDRVLMRVQTDPIKVNGVASAARRCSIAAVRLDQRVGLSTIEGDLK